MLLILAVVSIGSIQENGLIEKANGAVEKWNQAQNDEGAIMNSYLDYLGGDSNSSEICANHTWAHEGIEWGGGEYASNCTVCGYICNHPSLNTIYILHDDLNHVYETRCTFCNRGIIDGLWGHEYDDSGKCVCGREQ